VYQPLSTWKPRERPVAGRWTNPVALFFRPHPIV
jgi:hypothetical protein